VTQTKWPPANPGRFNTPTVTGRYGLRIDTNDGEMGSYSFTVNANPPPTFTGDDNWQ
jgi:hypothetical protein